MVISRFQELAADQLAVRRSPASRQVIRLGPPAAWPAAAPTSLMELLAIESVTPDPPCLDSSIMLAGWDTGRGDLTFEWTSTTTACASTLTPRVAPRRRPTWSRARI